MSEQMQPGRELDAAVAERLMGQQVVGEALCWRNPECTGLLVDLYQEHDSMGGYNAGRQPVWVDHCSCDIERDPDIAQIGGHSTFCLEVVPFYSRDIAAAWQVVERLIAASYTFRVRFEVNQQWYCEFALRAKGWHASSDTAPHAIAVAALAALGAK